MSIIEIRGFDRGKFQNMKLQPSFEVTVVLLYLYHLLSRLNEKTLVDLFHRFHHLPTVPACDRPGKFPVRRALGAF